MYNKMVKCKTCGAEIAKTAKRCPKCGAQQHQGALIACSLIIVFTIIAVVAVLVSSNSIETSTTTDNSADGASVTADIVSVTSANLLQEYSDNGVAADSKYKDKTIQISGEVSAVSTDVLDQAFVLLSDNSEFSITSVQCYFKNDQLSNLSALHQGDYITVEGKCTGQTINVIVTNCTIVQ